MDVLKPKHVQQLLQYFASYTYKAKETHPVAVESMNRCLSLMSLDYDYVVVNNSSGDLSDRYPSHLIILESEKNPQNGNTDGSGHCTTGSSGIIYESAQEVAKLRDLIAKARFARCRSRFPLPVIMFRGKYICRSATLSGGPELYGRSGLNFFFSGNNENIPVTDEEEEEMVVPRTQSEWQLFDKVRSQDIRLLKTLNIGNIIDLMVEKKKIKFGVYVTSSEKVDKENRYNDFNIVALPYPGCEFFKEFRENDHSGDGLVYDWSHPQVDTVIGIPIDSTTDQLKIDWSKYQAWDLTQLTKNYMKLIIRYLQESNSGLLIHCISGWDRTPLFVSLLRLSLWADEVIHQSLDAIQILYLTLAYDWMLFGHHLVDRLSRGEEIMLFCFHFLLHLADPEYSVHPRLKSTVSSNPTTRPDPDALFVDFEVLEAEAQMGSNGSHPSSVSSQCSRSQDPPSVFCTLPDFLEESSNGNYQHSGQLPAWAMLPIPVEGEEPLSGQYTPPGQASSPAASPKPCGSGPTASNSSPRSSCHRTSPMAVPISSQGRLRSRQDSSGSISTGSWQIISDTGSLRGWSSASTYGDSKDSRESRESQNSNLQSAGRPRFESSLSAQSSMTVVEDDCFTPGPASYADIATMRKERLKTVQTLFFNIYHSTSPLPSEGLGIGTFLGNFAEKVGIFQTAHS